MTTRRRPPGGGRDRLLTPRRQQILDYIRESMERRGFPPSMREIADAVGLKSASTVSYHFKILKEAGYLDRDPRLPRTVVPRPPVSKSFGLSRVRLERQQRVPARGTWSACRCSSGSRPVPGR